MIDFRKTTEGCEMNEVSFKGPRFTWDNGCEENEFIQERLDYAFANEPWLGRFSGALVTHLNRQGQDHVPILVSLTRCEESNNGKRLGSGPSCFEALWAAHEGCEAVI